MAGRGALGSPGDRRWFRCKECNAVTLHVFVIKDPHNQRNPKPKNRRTKKNKKHSFLVYGWECQKCHSIIPGRLRTAPSEP